MRRLLVLLAFVLSGCGWLTDSDLLVRDARIVANTAAMTLAASQSTAELLYDAEQRLEVERSANEPGITKDEIRRRVEVIRRRWEPVKALFADARLAHAALATALDEGRPPQEVAPLAAKYAGLETQIASVLDEARKRLMG